MSPACGHGSCRCGGCRPVARSSGVLPHPGRLRIAAGEAAVRRSRGVLAAPVRVQEPARARRPRCRSDADGGRGCHARRAAARGIVAEEVDAGRVKRVLALGSDAPGKYTGIVLLGLVGATVLFNCRRADRTAFWFFIAMLLASIACATGPDSVWESNWATLDALLMLPSVPASCRLLVLAGLAVSVAFLVLLAWRKLSTFRRWIVAAGVRVPSLFLSPFRIITRLPGFREVRAPFAFYDLPEVFAVAMLAGFFVTDVLSRERWRAQVPKVVAILALLMLLDHWPNQRPPKDGDVPHQTLANLESVYRSLRSDESWSKVYGVSTRYFHLLGPMYSNKPMVYEAWTNWMSPLG